MAPSSPNCEGSPFGHRYNMAQIHHDLAFWIEFHVRAVHRPGRGSLEIDAFRIVPAAMTRALNCFRWASSPAYSQVRTDGGDHEDALRVAHPRCGIGSETWYPRRSRIGWIADAEAGLGFVEGAREEKPQEHQEFTPKTPSTDAITNLRRRMIDFCGSASSGSLKILKKRLRKRGFRLWRRGVFPAGGWGVG